MLARSVERAPGDVRVLHLIHDTTVGGVEAIAAHLQAALRGPGPLAADVQYRVASLAGAPPGQEALVADVEGTSVNSPFSALRLLREARRQRPQVTVTSLWRVVALGPLARRLSGGRWALWVHSSRFTNRFDRAVHLWAIPRADVVLVDSVSAYENIVRPALARAGTSVPHVLVHPRASPIFSDDILRRAPRKGEPLRLVFWGRLATSKRLDRIVEFLGRADALWPGGARLDLIGPDDGGLESALALAESRGLRDRITRHGPSAREEIGALAAAAHVFVQLSDFEGYAMSAHEALSAGMVCVLTPVGELVADTADGVDALLVDEDTESAAERLISLAQDTEAFEAMGSRARSRHCASSTDMAEAFVQACRRLAGAERPGARAAARRGPGARRGTTARRGASTP
jgi:glycosyltransferase involved in cell wall biosynthesis